MSLTSKVFQSSGTWERLCEDVCAWVTANVKKDRLVSIAMSESGRALLDTSGTVIVWYWE